MRRAYLDGDRCRRLPRRAVAAHARGGAAEPRAHASRRLGRRLLATLGHGELEAGQSLAPHDAVAAARAADGLEQRAWLGLGLGLGVGLGLGFGFRLGPGLGLGLG